VTGVQTCALPISQSFLKARRVAQLCGTFHLPILFFHDTPGVLTSRQQEHDSLITKGMDFMVALAEADVPKVSIVVRKSYGLAYFVMNGSAPANNFTFSWPTGSIAFMAPEPAVRIAYRHQLEAAADKAALEQTLGEPFRSQAEPWEGAKMAGLDDVIDPRDTRPLIIKCLEFGLGAGKAARRRWPPQR
jgi:acetyl-CoA carboxylase carboxyltransferase component